MLRRSDREPRTRFQLAAANCSPLRGLLWVITQIDDTDHERGLDEWWNVRWHFGQRAETVRVAPQLFQAADPVMLSARITQKAPESSAISTDGNRSGRYTVPYSPRMHLRHTSAKTIGSSEVWRSSRYGHTIQIPHAVPFTAVTVFAECSILRTFVLFPSILNLQK